MVLPVAESKSTEVPWQILHLDDIISEKSETQFDQGVSYDDFVLFTFSG